MPKQYLIILLIESELYMYMSFPGGASGKEPTCQCIRHKRPGFDPWVRKIPWRRKWQPSPLFLPGKSHGQRSLAGQSPQGRKKRDTIEHTHKQQCVCVCLCSYGGNDYRNYFKQVIYERVKVKSLSSVRLFAPRWIVACQACSSNGKRTKAHSKK